MLAVDRDQLAPPVLGGLLHELAGDDECFLVRQRDSLPGFQCGECRIEAGCSHDCVDDDVDITSRRGFDQRRAASAPALAGVCSAFDHPDESRAELAGLFLEQRGIRVGGERRHPETRALALQHPERRRSDGSRGAEDGDPLWRGGVRHRGMGSSSLLSIRYATGSTNKRLSKRSRMPPCPGIIRELSFTPASRLSNDSARSPVWAATLITIANRIAP